MKPTLKEVKEHFKDAKVVRCIDFAVSCDITINIEKDIHSFGEDWCIDTVCNNEVRTTFLWSKEKGYAEIIEYKTKPTQINIDIPQGYEIDKNNSTFECIKFKKIEKQLPNSWVDYMRHFSCSGAIIEFNLLPETYKALRKLELLRDCYNDGWVADYKNVHQKKYCIYYISSRVQTMIFTEDQCLLNFKTAELRDKFLENFKDIIEIAKPLL